MTTLYWGRVWADLGFFGAWGYVRVRPRCFWLVRRIWRFFRYWWLRASPAGVGVISASVAWLLADLGRGFDAPVQIHREAGPDGEA